MNCKSCGKALNYKPEKFSEPACFNCVLALARAFAFRRSLDPWAGIVAAHNALHAYDLIVTPPPYEGSTR